jgi:Mrp family chromosome partitioning ATPase/uncharacterized protein involved in exopolysaccharide biosynthesis
VDSSQVTLVGAAWKHRLLVSTTIVLFIVGGLAFSAVARESSVFSAQALIVLQDPNSLEGSAPGERFILEQAEIMRSPIVAETAAAALEDTPIDPPVTAEELMETTSIGSSPDSSLVYLSAVDEDRDRAIAMVNGLATAYQDVVRLQSTESSDAALERIDAQLDSLEARFTELARDIRAERDANVDLSELQAQADESLERIAQLQAALASANEAQAEDIRQEISDYLARLESYRQAREAVGNSPAMLALLEEQEQLIARRTELLRSRDQIIIDAELAPGVVALMDTADEAIEFVESNTQRTLAVAGVLGVLTAFGASYLLELRRRSFGDRLEPERILGVPLLADIPLFTDEGLDTRLPTRDAPRSAAAEGFRFAAASIQDSMRSVGAKSVMMVGATLGQGKSTTIVNTTMANARRGHSVLLIDCDFGNQDATRLLLGFDTAPNVGLIDVVDGDAFLKAAISKVVLDDDVSLDLLSRGGRSTVAANVLSAKEAGVVFESAAAKYDIVFVDAPPILQVAYASTVARYVDALVIVVSHDSQMRELEELVKRLQLIGTPILGYIYNRSPLRKQMTAVDGSLMDILGTEGDYFDQNTERSWWQRIRI